MLEVYNEGLMELGIKKIIQLIKLKNKANSLTVFVPTKKLADIFIANLEKEIELEKITGFETKVDLNIFIGDSNEEEKGSS